MKSKNKIFNITLSKMILVLLFINDKKSHISLITKSSIFSNLLTPSLTNRSEIMILRKKLMIAIFDLKSWWWKCLTVDKACIKFKIYLLEFWPDFTPLEESFVKILIELAFYTTRKNTRLFKELTLSTSSFWMIWRRLLIGQLVETKSKRTNF